MNMADTRQRPLRVAFVGKGGSGKSTIAALFARTLAQQGEKVIALDSDPMPGLSYALGLEVDDAPIPGDLVIQGPKPGPEWLLKPNIEPLSLVEKYSLKTPEGVHYFQFGNTRGTWGPISKGQHVWSEVVKQLPLSAWSLVGDLPGGLRQPMNGWGKYAEIALIVTEPTTKGIMTARQLAKLTLAKWGPRAIAVVVNKVQAQDNPEEIARRINLPLVGVVPENSAIQRAEAELRSPYGLPGSENVEFAIRELIETVRRI